jgi:hypothetical protein
MQERVTGFRKAITPKSMRRSNKDLLRQEGISQLVAQAINSHDDVIHKHYSTVSEVERGAALAKVIHLFPKAPKVAKKRSSRQARPPSIRPTVRETARENRSLNPPGSRNGCFSCRRDRFRTYDPYRVKATVTSLRGVTDRYSQNALN